MNITRLVVIPIVVLIALCHPLAGVGELNRAEPETEGNSESPDPITRPPVAPPGEVVSVDHAEMADLWLVELESPPIADGGLLKDTGRDKDRFRASANQAGLVFEERFAFDTLWNGLSIRIHPKDLGKLALIPHVAALYPVQEIRLDTDMRIGSGTDLFNALSMTGANIAHSELGLSGAGVRVAITDTGIDYDHPDLGGCFGPGCRVETGWDFVGDEYEGPWTAPFPDPDPDDCYGHGTHVAGIVGADGEITGVAPGVTFGAYRVFGCRGVTTEDIMIAAMERALVDEMDVLNMSIGSAFQWPDYPTAAAATRLVDSGVVVVASFGNAGSAGLYSGSAPGMGDKVIGVASFHNSHISLPVFEAGGRGIPYSTMFNAGEPPQFGANQIVYIGRGCAGDPRLANPAGKIALVQRGGCSDRTKAFQAIIAGATGVVIHNDRPGIFFGSVGEPRFYSPVIAITQADGLYLRSLAEPVNMAWTDRSQPVPIEGGGLISGFSSWGLSPDLGLKPDIGAPGGLIYSTIPLEHGGYAFASGTSMSSPHVAGAAALVLEANPHTPSQAVRDVLQNSADPVINAEGMGTELPESVHRQGAGLIDIDDAVRATARITPAKLPLGEGRDVPLIRDLAIENKAASTIVFDLSHVPAMSTGGTIEPSFSTSAASVSLPASVITVPPGGTASVEVSILPPSALTHGQYGGYLVFTPRDGGPAFQVPYAGFTGDYQLMPVLTPTSLGLPWLAKWGRYGFTNQPYGARYTLQSVDVPWFLVHLDHQVRKLRMEVFDPVGGQSWHRALNLDYFGRNSTPNSYWYFSWNGQVSHGRTVVEIPDGIYRIRISVQKALGDDDDPAHWESWISPPITIARP
jgi:subtilisin family serine protease